MAVELQLLHRLTLHHLHLELEINILGQLTVCYIFITNMKSNIIKHYNSTSSETHKTTKILALALARIHPKLTDTHLLSIAILKMAGLLSLLACVLLEVARHT